MTDDFISKIENALALWVPGGPSVLEGWTTPETGLQMAELILEHKPQTVVEIGVFGGRSLIAQAMALRENGSGKIYGIDPWKSEAALEGETDPEDKKWWSAVDLHDIHRGAMEAIWEHGLDEWVTIIRARSEHVPHLFAGGIDLLLIDGNHSEVSSCRDVKLYVPQLNTGAFCWFDDCDWKETAKAQQLILETCDLVRSDNHLSLYRRK